MPRPTLNDIARQVGFSKNTVSLALRGDPQIPEVTRERIRRVADEVGYQPNAIVSHLMAQLRASRTTRLQAKLALVNANRDPDAFRTHPTIPTYVDGCESRAAKLGYSFDRFWLHDPTLNASRWLRILLTRGIKGLVLVGLMDTNHLPDELRGVWEQLPTVVTGVRTRDPALSFCSVDHHNLALMAFERAAALGYRRPGLVLDDVIDALVERRFSAGYFTGQRTLPRAQHIPIFSEVAAAQQDPARFHAWLKRYEPDVVFTLYNNVLSWLKAAGRRVPQDLGVIQLEWRSTRPEIAGLNQHNFVTGEAAVDMVVSQIHNNETGVQEFPRATLIGATWVDGPSVREQRAGASEAPAKRRKKAQKETVKM
ncbi:LacI family DNA-binding transcriptional regulator [Opitutus terrae]|uniref:Transcriptional regulator, LacI family n=1 Tax=Opitutus terrae (strain DSM 11246 / JCM 15787 / PB90-1) TaxID=452637 RepID=B1ZRZ3_OPITP|nr:LacI family DNA-binding transcriptional regulator [Opitutus terrae]ACB74669.1 transcriptional regulator, LacI family [Opitutus terrae PB90-1]